MLRAGQGQVPRAIHVVEVFLQYQQYGKKGVLQIINVLLKENAEEKQFQLMKLWISIPSMEDVNWELMKSGEKSPCYPYFN